MKIDTDTGKAGYIGFENTSAENSGGHSGQQRVNPGKSREGARGWDGRRLSSLKRGSAELKRVKSRRGFDPGEVINALQYRYLVI